MSACALVALCLSGIGVASSSAATYTKASGLAYAQVQVKKYSSKVTFPAVPAVSHVAKLRGKTIWYVPITNAVSSLAGMGSSMKAALSYVGAKVQVCDGGGLPTTVATCLTNASQQGAAAVVTSYVDYDMAPTGFQALAAANIPVVVGNEPPDQGVTSTKELQFTYGTAQTDLFLQLTAFQTIVASKGTAHVLVVELTDSPSTTAASQLEVNDFKTYCPDCTVTTITMQTASISQVPAAVSAALVANPDTNWVTVPVDSYLPPVEGGIQSAGFASKVKVVAPDGDLSGLQSVKSGQLAYNPGGPIEYQGWQYANSVIRLLSGDSVPPEPAGPTLIFGPSNVKKLTLNAPDYLRLNWYGVSQSAFQNPYLKAWGVK